VERIEGAALGFALTFIEGRGVLSLDGGALPAAGRVEHLAMEIPDLRFPFDLSGGASRFQNRRCRLRELSLSVSAEDLRALAERAPLADFGVFEPEVQMAGGVLRLSARAVVGEREAEFTALGLVRRAWERGVRLSFFDVRVYGFLPVAAPLLCAAVFTALGAASASSGRRGTGSNGRVGGGWVSAPSPLLRVVGPSDLELDILDLALCALLPAHGWRLPDRNQLQLRPVEVVADRLTLHYAPAESEDEDSGPLAQLETAVAGAEQWAYEEARQEFRDAEAALLAGDVPVALEAYRRAAAVQPQNRFVTTRLLQLLTCSPATLGEAEEIASAALARAPDFAPALLARAVAAAEGGRPAEAAQIYLRLAELAETSGWRTEEACARVAASNQRLATGDAAGATADLERALEKLPAHRGLLRALSGRLAAEERWPDLLNLLRQRAAEEPDPRVRAALHAQSGLVLLDRLGDRARARDRFEQAMRLDLDQPGAWEGLGRLQALEAERAAAAESFEKARRLYAAQGQRQGQARIEVSLAELDQAVGDEETALARLRRAADLDADALEALERAGEIAFRLGRHGEAVAALEGALSRARRAEDKVLVWRRLAVVCAQGQNDGMSARLLLEQALRERPADLGALDDLRALLVAQGALDDLHPFLQRALDHSADFDERRAILCQLVEVERATGARAALVLALLELATCGDAEGVKASLEVAAMAEDDSGLDAGSLRRAAQILEAYLAQPDEPESLLPRGEMAFRLALLRQQLGEEDAALEGLRLALATDLEGELARSAWQRCLQIVAPREDAAALAQILVGFADDVRTGEDERARAAHLLEAARIFDAALGAPEEAATLLERTVALDPENDEAFAALETTLERLGAWERLSQALRQRLAARRGDTREVLHRMATLLSARLGRPEEGAEIWHRILEQDPQDGRARLELARHLWRIGNKQESAREFEELLQRTSADASRLPEVRLWTSEAHLRLAQWARVVGKMADAQRQLARALEGEPAAGAPVEVLVEVLEAFGRTKDLIELLGQRRAALPPEAAREVGRALGAVLERVGRSDEAVELYRSLLEQTPDDVACLLRLAEVFRREARASELVAPLERLFRLADQLSDGVVAGEGGETADVEAIGLELATLLYQTTGAFDRAEAVLRRLLERNPASGEALQGLSELLLAQGELDGADDVLTRRAEIEGDPALAAQLLTERARLRLSKTGGDAAAYALLRIPALEVLLTEGLIMRADLAERLGDVADALSTLGRLRSVAATENDAVLAADVSRRLAELALTPTADTAKAIALWEEMLAQEPGDALAAETLFQLYGHLGDEGARNRSWQALLQRASGLDDSHRGRVHMAMAETAEREGDLALADEELRKSLALDSDPGIRVAQLVAHARVLVSLKAVDDATADLEEALTLVPDHGPALLLLADLAYRSQSWQQARDAYDRLAVAPGASELIASEVLAFRRAELAEMFGDEAEAEAAYREVAGLNPRHIGAREALAQIAVYREDLPEAAQQLEELLKLYPAEALDKITQTRQQLAEMRARLGDDEGARHQLELLIAEDPNRTPALEILVPLYGRLGLHREAAHALGHLARLYTDPRKRAETLFQQGDLLQNQLGDEEAANDAFLRSSDIDPTFAPTLVRLVRYYWRRGQFQDVAEVGAELVKQGYPALGGASDSRLLVALASVAKGEDMTLAKAALADGPLPAEDVAATRLSELAARLGEHAPAAIDRALDLLLDVDGASLAPLQEGVARLAAELPARPGAAEVLARLARRIA
jgi:tetratricopeptide (TPR) repeat protein